MSEQKFDKIQLSYAAHTGNKEHFLLSVLAKRSYQLDKNQRWVHDPIASFFEDDTKFYHETGELMAADYELYPIKPFTDVIVKGFARARANEKALQAIVEVSGFAPKKIQVFGNRKAYLNASGQIKFTEPEPVGQVPLRYDFAYGGIDHIMEEKLPPTPPELKNKMPDIDWDYASAYRYPRNTCGKGYVIEKNNRIFENLALPNLEDPNYLLSPNNLVLEDAFNWLNQPIPMATDWVNVTWFPRIAYLGILPVYEAKKLKGMLPEHGYHLAEPDVLHEKPMEQKFNARACNGASLGLQLTHLDGREQIRLVNIHPQSADFSIKLPVERPRIWIDGRKGKLIETKPVIHTVIYEPDEGKLTLVWRGSGQALRPYFEEELLTMPFKVDWT